MKKRILSLTLALLLTLGCLAGLAPVKASAATTSQWNIVNRANYMWNSTWYCRRTVAGWSGTFYAGNTYRLPYGQPVYSGQYIGFGVSVDTFKAATADPNSIFYTGRSHCGGTRSTYYATDCSAFVSYCWGVSRRTTYSIPQISSYLGMANSSNVQKLQIGDALNSNSVGHVVLVTGLSYSGGRISQIEITEQTPPQLKRSYYSPTGLANKYGSYYGIYRYYGNVPGAPGGGSGQPAPSNPRPFANKTPADLGTDFEAKIGYPNGGLKLTLDGSDSGIVTYNASSSPAQVWTFYRQSDGSYKIVNKKTGKCLDVNGAYSSNGTKIQIWDDNGSSAQRWFLYPANGGYFFRPACADAGVMDVNGGSKSPSTKVQLWEYNNSAAQIFAVEKQNLALTQVDLGTDFDARITNVKANLNVTLDGSDNGLVTYGASFSDAQIWHFYRQGDGTYKIVNKKTGRCMDVYGASSANETSIINYADNGSAAQRWRIFSAGGGYVFSPVCAPASAMDVAGGSTAPSTKIQLYQYNASQAQIFRITKDTGPENFGNDFYARIGYKHGGMNLGLNAQNSVVIQKSSSVADQIWHFIRQGDGSYKIVNKQNGLCMDASNSGTDNGTSVLVWADHGGSNQRWYVHNTGTGYVFRPAYAPNSVLDVNGYTTVPGTQLWLYQFNNSIAQHFTIDKVDINAKPAISNVSVSNVTSTGYTVSCTVSSGSGITEVKFPTWTEHNGQDDVVTRTGSADGTTYSYRVNIKDHNGEGGKYITEIRAYDCMGNVATASTSAVIDLKPILSDVRISDVSMDGYTVTCTATSTCGIKEVRFPTWTERNGQDDIVWHLASRSGNTFSYRVKVSEHNDEGGKYITHVYAYDNDGNYTTSSVETVVKTPAEYLATLPMANLGDDFYAKITNIHANLNLSLDGTDYGVITYNNSTSPAQLWRFVRQPDGSYKIVNKKTGKCLDVANASSASGTEVNIWQDNGTKAQRWFVYSYGGGYILSPACARNNVLDVTGASTQPLARLISYAFNGSGAQIFAIENSVPVISDVAITNVSATGFTVSCKATAATGITEVKFPTWTEKNGQDDIVWHTASRNGDTYSCRINTTEHKNEGGKYIIHAYAYDSKGNAVCQPTSTEINVTPVNLGDDFYSKITNISANLNLTLDGTDYGVVTYQSSTSPAQIWRFVRQADGSYKIVNKKTGKCLDVYGASSASGTKVIIYADNGSSAQRWNIYQQGNGYILVPKCAPTNALDVYGGSTEPLATLQSYTFNGTGAQIFRIRNDKPVISNVSISNVTADGYTVTCTATSVNGISQVQMPTWTEHNGQDDIVWNTASQNGNTFSFRVRISDHKNEGGKYITHIYAYDVLGNASSVSTGATVNTDFASQNGLTLANLGDDFYAKITNTNANLNLSLDGQDYGVITYTNSSSPAQVWHFLRQANGSYKIVNKKTGKCLDVSGGTSNVGAKVIIYADNGTDAQRWNIYRKGSGYVLMPLCAPKNALDVNGASTATMAILQSWSYNGTGAQIFAINPISSANQIEVLRKIMYAVESGGQVYGNADYTNFTAPYTNSSIEHSITIGAGQWYGTEAKNLLNRIRSTDPAMFARMDTAGIGYDLDTANWASYQIAKGSAKAVCIQNIIGTSVGRSCQDKLMDEQMTVFMQEAEKLGVTDLDAQMMCANIRHQGGYSALTRVLNKTGKPYTLDRIYAALQTDTGNQVGAYKSRQRMVYNALKQYLN